MCGATAAVVLRAATFMCAWPSDARFAWSARLLSSCAGKIKHSLILHPDDTHIIYPLGSTIVVKNVEDTDDQIFLQGARTALGVALGGDTWRRLPLSPARARPHAATSACAFDAHVCARSWWTAGARAVLRRPCLAVEAAAARLPPPPSPPHVR